MVDRMYHNTVLFSDECTMHIRRPLGKHFDKKYIVVAMKHPLSQMIWGAMSCRGAAGLYFIPPNTTMNGTRVRGIAQGESETARARPRRHNVHAIWRYLSPIKGSH